MERTLNKPQATRSTVKPENAPIFGLYYLEEHDFDLNEVVGCFGASSIDPTGGCLNPTYTCPGDDTDCGHEP